MFKHRSTPLRALALATACLTAACTAPFTPQDTRSLKVQVTEGTSIRLQALDLASGPVSLDLEASEAILALTNPTPETLTVQAAFEGTERPEAQRHVASLGGPPLAECGIRPYRPFASLAPRAPRLPIRGMEAPAPSRALEATMSFILGGNESDTSIPVPQATLRYPGTHCAIYVDDRDAEALTPEDAEALGRIFDAQSYDRLVAAFGAEPPNPGDGFNFGQDKTIFLFTEALAESTPGSAGMVDMVDFHRPEVTAQAGLETNYAKMVYMLPSAMGPMTPGTMAHEFVHVLFALKRLTTYADVHAGGGGFGWNPAYYLDDTTYFAELGMNEGLAELGKFIAGYAPDDLGIAVERIGYFLGNPQLFDLLNFHGAAGANYGGMSLFNSYLYGLDPTFPQRFLTAEATGSEAIAEAMGKDFPGLYRDFTLAMALDGMSPLVPSRYQIPMVDLHKTYAVGAGLQPLRGANDSSAPLVLNAPRPHGVRFTRVRFPSGKGKLTLSGDPRLKASLIVLKEGNPPGFQGD